MTTRRQWHAKGLKRPAPGPRRLWLAAQLSLAPLSISATTLMTAIACLKPMAGDLVLAHWLEGKNLHAGKTGTHMSRRDFAHFGGSGVGSEGTSAVCGAIRGGRPEWGPESFFASSVPPTCAECAMRWDEAMKARELITQKQIAEIRKRFPNWTPRGGLGPHREEIRTELKTLGEKCT